MGGGTASQGSIVIVAGTRPEAVKLAPVARALAARGHRPWLVATGQHGAMLAQGLADFGLTADDDLAVMRPRQTPDALIGRLVPRLAGLFRSAPPAAVVVQGDTATAFAAAQAARYAGVPVAHVEAGLRSGSNDPHPEEMHRRAIAQLADLHLAPTAAAAAALAREGVAADRVHITGNSGIDALLWMRDRLRAVPALAGALGQRLAVRDRRRPLVLATVHRRENQGPALAGIAATLAALAGEADIAIPVHPNPAVARPLTAVLAGRPGVWLLPPLGYAPFVALMQAASLALTDSGGVQEEAPALGLPVLVLRAVTERAEGLASGNARLVGSVAGEILAAARALLADGAALARMAEPALPYGDGGASARIAALLIRSYL